MPCGGSLRTILRVMSGTFAGFTNIIVAFVRAGFLDLASGGWLTLLAYYVFNVVRIPATFATGNVLLTNSGGGIYTAVQIGQLRVIGSATKKTYTNTAVFTLNPGDTNISVAVQAEELGAASTAAPGTIDALETILPGVTVTNSTAVVGSDAELDPALQQRCKDKLATLSGLGPRGAYSYAVRSAVRTDGSIVDINRLSISPSSSTGVVTVYVASPAGAPSTADLDFIRASIESTARPDTVTVNVFAATALPLTKTITVWAKRTDGLSADDLTALVNTALVLMIRDYPIGGFTKPPSTSGFLYASTIDGTAKSAHPAVFAVDGVGGDLAMSPGQVATLATTINIRFSEAIS